MELKTPVVIPSLFRKQNYIHKCLSSIYENYDPVAGVHVILQEYPESELSMFEKYPNIHLDIQKKFEDGIVGVFNYLHRKFSSLYPRYIFMEDDVKLLSTRGVHQPTLKAFEEILVNFPKVGIVSSLPKNLQREKPDLPFFRFSGNPAQLIGFNSEASCNISADENFRYYRTDTDLSLQIVKQNYSLVMLCSHFTHHHMAYISKKNDKGGYTLIMDNGDTSTQNRTEELWKLTEKKLADKWGLKLNKNGRAMYWQYVKSKNIIVEGIGDVLLPLLKE